MKLFSILSVSVALCGCGQQEAIEQADGARSVQVGQYAEVESSATPTEDSPRSKPNLPNAEGREHNFRAAESVGSERIRQLVLQLQSDDVAVRNQAARGFEEVGPKDKDLVPALVAALDEEDSLVRLAAVNALARIGPDAKAAVPALIRLLESSPPHPTGDVGSEPAEAPHPETLKPPRNAPRSRSTTLEERILEQGGPDLEVNLTRQIELAAASKMLRAAAASALGRIGPEAKVAVPALRKALQDPDRDVSLAAAGALWNIDRRADVIVPVLAELLTHDDSAIRAAEILAEIGPAAKPAVPALQPALVGETGNLRVAAAEALWKIDRKAEPVVTALVAAMKSDEEAVRESAAVALGKIILDAETVAVPALIEALGRDTKADGS